MAELMPSKLKLYVNARMPDEAIRLVDRAITRTLLVKSSDGERSSWVRDAAVMRAEIEGDYLSGHMAAVLERYRALVALERPDWPTSYWEVLIKATQEGLGHMPGNERLRPVLLKSRLLDVVKESAAPVLRALEALTYAQVMAVLDVCERHWAAVVRGEDPPPLPGQAESASSAAKPKKGKS